MNMGRKIVMGEDKLGGIHHKTTGLRERSTGEKCSC